MDERKGSPEARDSNRQNIEKAFLELTAKVQQLLDSVSDKEPTATIYSSSFQLERNTGKVGNYKVALSPLDLQKRDFTVEVKIVDMDNSMIAKRALYPEPDASFNVDNIRRALDRRTVEYWSEIKVRFEDYKSVGIGSTLLEQSEKLAISIWEKIGKRKQVDTLRIILRDRSDPPQWTTRQATQMGYEPSGSDREDNPRFIKEISLSTRRTRFGGLLGRFSE